MHARGRGPANQVVASIWFDLIWFDLIWWYSLRTDEKESKRALEQLAKKGTRANE